MNKLCTALLLAASALPAQVVDAHQHFSNRANYFEDLERTYRAHNARACVNGFARDLKTIAAAARQYPETIIPFGRIRLDDASALADLDAFRAAGFKGIKIHSPEKDYDDLAYFPIYERAQQHGFILLLHTGINSRGGPAAKPSRASMARMRPSFLSTVARAFPRLNIIGAHLGNPWYEEAAEAARWDPNLYFDVTGSTLIKKQGNLRIFREIFWWSGLESPHTPKPAAHAFEKLVFGTDEDPLNLAENLTRYRRMLEACEVPAAAQQNILGGTMARLLSAGSP